MFSNPLIPVDGSNPAMRAARFGLELAATYDTAVDVIHVVAGDDTDASEQGEQLLAEVQSLERDEGTEVQTPLVEGKPANKITAHAADAGTDLVVMGRHGRTGISEHLLGSTSERVLRGVDVPVLTVPGGTGADIAVENVLLTTDGSEVAERAAPYGVDVADRFAATLHLLSVFDVQAEAGPFDVGGVDSEFVERLETSARESLDRLTEDVDCSGLDVREAVRRGWPIEEISGYADEHEIDLVVMASKGETNLVRQKLGSTTSRVLNSVKRPVLVVPSSD